MTLLFTALLTAFFCLPFAASARGHLRRRWAVLIAVGLVVLVTFVAALFPVAIAIATSTTSNPHDYATDPVYVAFAGGYLYAIMVVSFALPVAWWVRHNKTLLVRAVMLFGANFDPRLAPRGPLGKMGSNKYLAGTKPPTGSRRLAALRHRITHDLLDMGEPAKRPAKRGAKRR